MQPRSLLRSQLLNAWHRAIEDEYSDQLINSERGLQIYFCKHLLDQFQESGVRRRLFIEPRISISTDGQAKYPDIVICHTRSIIGVVEIKYLPRARPDYIKDLNTLDWLLKNGKEVKLSNDRYRGEREVPREFSLAPDAVLCWAGVYTSPQETIQLPGQPGINGRVMVMHALTQAGQRAQPLPSVSGQQ